MAYITFHPKDYFNTVLYTGNGSDAHGITGVGFQPDWVWTKIRSGADNHGLYDVVRGVNKNLQTNSNYAEQSYSTLLQSFDSDGFTIGTNGEINGNSSTFVSWNWRAGNSQGSSNTDGSINTTYTSVNTTAGFSIVQWTGNGSDGATIAHGLGAVPKMVIVKSSSNSENWNVYHEDITSADNGNLYLNSSNAYAASGGNRWARSSISSSVFGLGSDGTTNGNGQTYIAYCFAEKTGYSKFGKYTGNGNADGPFVYTGFKPAMIIFKITSSTGDWRIFDSKRDTFNVADAILYPSATNAEGTEISADFLSNGFKIRSSSSSYNTSGGTYIYMAFAEEPLVSSNNIPATAR